MTAIYHIEGESRFTVPSKSRPQEAHIVSYHRTSEPNVIESRCTCPHYTIGNPARIKKGLPPKPCRHINLVNQHLLYHAQKKLIEKDTSQTQERSLWEVSAQSGLRTTS